jgi:hypothetical protein
MKYGHSKAANENQRQMTQAMAARFDAQTRVCLGLKGSSVIGYALSVTFGDTLYVRECGFDHTSVPEKAYAYFNVLLYGPLEQAIAERLTVVDYGMGTLEVKLRRGVSVRPLCHVLESCSGWQVAPLKHDLKAASLAGLQRLRDLVERLIPDDAEAAAALAAAREAVEAG